MSPQQIVLDEFAAHYHGDELGPDVVERSLDRMAAASAERMRFATKSKGRAELTALLAELRDHRDHPLHGQISDHTLLSWTADDADFALFGRLVNAMIAGLES